MMNANGRRSASRKPLTKVAGRNAVKQDRAMGCGVAAVAFVLGISYERARQLFVGTRRDGGAGYSRKAMAQALHVGGSKYRLVHRRRQSINEAMVTLDDLCIVYARHDPDDGWRH